MPNRVNFDKPLKDLTHEIIGLYAKLKDARHYSIDTKFEDTVYANKIEPLKTLPDWQITYTLKGHLGRILDIKWVPEKFYLLSVSVDNTIIIWNAENGFIYNVINADGLQPTSVATSNDLKTIFCGGMTARVLCYNGKHRTEQDGYTEYTSSNAYEHKGKITEIFYSSGDNRFYTAGEADGVSIWDIEKVVKIGNFIPPNTIVTAMNCRIKENFTLAACSDGTVRMYDTRTNENAAKEYPGHAAQINCIEYNPKLPAFATGSDDFYTLIFDIRIDSPIQQLLKNPIVDIVSSTSHYYNSRENSLIKRNDGPPKVNDCTFTPSGRIIITGLNNWSTVVWDIVKHENPIFENYENGPVMKVKINYKKNVLASAIADEKNIVRLLRPSDLAK